MESESLLRKLRERMRFWNWIDPFYWVVWIVHLPFLLSELKDHEEQFIHDNISKHRFSWWLTAVVLWCVVHEEQHDDEMLKIAAFALTTAWYIITFAAIPQRFIHISMYISFFMFTGFWSSQCALSIPSFQEASVYTTVKYCIVLTCVYVASVLYDSADGLKAGLDEAQLRSSRAQLMWHEQEHNIRPEELD